MVKITKILLSILILFTMVVNGLAQNLVPNGDFENYTLCPDGASELDRLTDWFNPTAGTADFYNSCYTTGWENVDVPNNFFGFQSPASGNGYIGLFLHYYYTLYREYAEVKLIDSLIVGNKYYVSFSVSLADSSNFATDDVGIYFSNDSLLNLSSYDNFSVFPHVESTQGTFLSDKSVWYLITGEYIASGGEKFLTIGNFKDDINTDTIPVSQGGSLLNDYFCYYYIDNVCVSLTANDCGITGINEISTPNILVYPNPSNGIVNLSSEKTIENLSVYSSIGQLIISNLPNTKNLQIDLSKHSKGIYYINIKTNQSVISKKIIIN